MAANCSPRAQERKEYPCTLAPWAAAGPVSGAHGGDQEWRQGNRVVGFVDSAGEATSHSEADGLA